MNNRTLSIWGLILGITIIWGYAWVLMKASLSHMGPFTFSAFRFGVGSVTLLLVVFLSKVKLPEKRYWKHLFVVGLLQTTIVFLLVMYGLRFVGAGKASIILYTMPIWSSIFAARFLGEKLTRRKLSGLLIGMFGLSLIIGWDMFQTKQFNMIAGEALIMVAAISWGASNVYYRLKLESLPKIQASAFQMLFGTIGIVFVAFVMEWGEPIHWNDDILFYILFTGVLASALCFTIWFILLSKIDMVSATLSTLLVPVFGLLFSWLQLREVITPSVLYGSIFIIIGIAISQERRRVRGQTPP